jgi:small-conductance mechanosensitive channel
MPVQITINGADAAESIQELSVLAAAISGKTAAAATPVVTEEPKSRQRRTSNKKDESKSEGVSQEVDLDALSKEIEEEMEAKEQSEGDDVEIPSVVDLRAKAHEVGKNAKDGKKAVKALLDKFESPSVSDVPEDKRIAFMDELEKLL